MENYGLIAQWIGWPPIVIGLLIVGGLGVWFFKARLDIQRDKYDLLENKFKESQNQTSVALVKELAETRGHLKEEIERLLGQSKHDSHRIMELEKELEVTNSQFESIQEILNELEFPRDGKFRSDIEGEILKTIHSQGCIYIPVGPFYSSFEIDPIKLASNNPYTLEVVFPGMFKMYLILYDCLGNHIGAVFNPYLGIYYKDYYVTLLHFLQFAPRKNVDEEGIYEGDVRILLYSVFHGVSITDPETFYIKVPFSEDWIVNSG
jgi:hypothetical protein